MAGTRLNSGIYKNTDFSSNREAVIAEFIS